jgi:hypothetical protein
MAWMVDTNAIAADVPLAGPATVHIHLGIAAGTPTANYSLSVQPEIYYTYSLGVSEMTLGDFSADPQTWTSGQNVGKTFALAWPTVQPTGTYYRVYGLKVTAKGSAITTANMGIGGTDASYVTFSTAGAEASAVAADLAEHEAVVASAGTLGHVYSTASVTGAVSTVSAGANYYWTTATNVALTASLTDAQVVNLAMLRNTATNSVTAIGEAGWVWTGGNMTNTIPAGRMMTFGWARNPMTGVTNAYATAASAN